MFNRFTRAARDVVERAVEEAGSLGHDQVGSEHMLLAVAARGSVPASLGLDLERLRAAARESSLDAAALATIGIDLDQIQRRVEESFGPGALRRARRRGRVRFRPDATQALERSLREALALSDRHIGPEHILLAVAGEPRSGAARALAACDIAPEALRAAVLAERRAAA